MPVDTSTVYYVATRATRVLGSVPCLRWAIYGRGLLYARAATVGVGGLEGLLSILVWLTCGSGIYGLYLSRTAPKRLSGIGHEVRYDHIAWHRSRVVERAEVLIGSFPATTGREVLDEYYHTRLKVFFQSQPGWLYFLFPTVQRRKRLLAGLTENYRYLPPELKAIAGELAALVRNRDDLDYHHAMQWRLRTWRYLHILLTALLILSASMHIVLAWRMEGM